MIILFCIGFNIWVWPHEIRDKFQVRRQNDNVVELRLYFRCLIYNFQELTRQRRLVTRSFLKLNDVSRMSMLSWLRTTLSFYIRIRIYIVVSESHAYIRLKPLITTSEGADHNQLRRQNLPLRVIWTSSRARSTYGHPTPTALIASNPAIQPLIYWVFCLCFCSFRYDPHPFLRAPHRHLHRVPHQIQL